MIAGHIRSELLDRLASPLYALVAGLIAFASLGEARTTRQGRGLAIGGAISCFRGHPHARHCSDDVDSRRFSRPRIFVWAIPIAAILGRSGGNFSPRAVFGLGSEAPHCKSGMIGRTLSLYLAGRFARTVIAFFCLSFFLFTLST